MDKTHKSFDAIKYLTLIVMACIILAPLYLIIVTAFKSGAELKVSGSFSLPKSFLNIDNFSHVLANGALLRGYFNTGFILIFSIIGNILVGTGAAYALCRFDFKLKKLILALYTISIIIPTTTTQVANFGIIKSLHLINTPYSLILLYVGADLVQLYLYFQFIKNIPISLDESVLVEGANYFTIYKMIILQMLKPAIVTTSILKIGLIYNDVFLPYLYMPSPKRVVVSTALMQFTSASATDFKFLSAATILVIAPPILLYLFFQRYIFAGITSGAVKE